MSHFIHWCINQKGKPPWWNTDIEYRLETKINEWCDLCSCDRVGYPPIYGSSEHIVIEGQLLWIELPQSGFTGWIGQEITEYRESNPFYTSTGLRVWGYQECTPPLLYQPLGGPPPLPFGGPLSDYYAKAWFGTGLDDLAYEAGKTKTYSHNYSCGDCTPQHGDPCCQEPTGTYPDDDRGGCLSGPGVPYGLVSFKGKMTSNSFFKKLFP